MVVTEGKGFFLFCDTLLLSDWVIETSADEAKAKPGGYFHPS